MNVISSKLGLPTMTIASVIEPYLLMTELAEKINSDRAITEKGRTHIENHNI